MNAAVRAWRERRRRRAERCQIDEEWCGSFIGRRWCFTHQVRWDNGGPCPKRAAR